MCSNVTLTNFFYKLRQNHSHRCRIDRWIAAEEDPLYCIVVLLLITIRQFVVIRSSFLWIMKLQFSFVPIIDWNEMTLSRTHSREFKMQLTPSIIQQTHYEGVWVGNE